MILYSKRFCLRVSEILYLFCGIIWSNWTDIHFSSPPRWTSEELDSIHVSQEIVDRFRELYLLGPNGDEAKRKELEEKLTELVISILGKKLKRQEVDEDKWELKFTKILIVLITEANTIVEERNIPWLKTILNRLMISTLEPDLSEEMRSFRLEASHVWVFSNILIKAFADYLKRIVRPGNSPLENRLLFLEDITLKNHALSRVDIIEE